MTQDTPVAQTDAERLAKAREMISPSDAVAWIEERYANCLRIAATKKDVHDRASWLTDAAFFEMTIALLAAATSRNEAPPSEKAIRDAERRGMEDALKSALVMCEHVSLSYEKSDRPMNASFGAESCHEAIAKLRDRMRAETHYARPSAPSEADDRPLAEVVADLRAIPSGFPKDAHARLDEMRGAPSEAEVLRTKLDALPRWWNSLTDGHRHALNSGALSMCDEAFEAGMRAALAAIGGREG